MPRTEKRTVVLPPGRYTQLYRTTEATMHKIGELVMQDTPDELNTHLDFMLRAHGDVLITGLGLGCVARGTLANPRVTRVTIIEKERDVLNLVMRHMPRDHRLQIIHADALTWTRDCDRTFDCAWHDLWTDEEKGEPHLQVWHAELFCNLSRKVRALQGAWAMPREQRRVFRKIIPIL